MLQNPLDKPLIDFGAGEEVDQASANLTNLSKCSSDNYFGTKNSYAIFVCLHLFILSLNIFGLF